MRALVRIALVALLALPFSACSDKADLLRPKASAELLIPFDPIQRPPRLLVVPNPEDFVEITAGFYHTCARKNNNRVFCWGRDEEGQAGGFTTKVCASSGAKCIDKPTYVMDARVVDAGGNHACALDSANAAFCWGSSSNGQVGAGVNGSVFSPVAVSGGLTFTSISAGMSSTCATSSSGMYCWGAIVTGGGAALSGATTPSQVSTYADYNAVSVGYLHACAYYRIGIYSGVDCWGNNRFGQAGSDPMTFPIVPFTLASGFGTPRAKASTEVDFTCADIDDGTVQCMGYNGWGQLGNGQTGGSTHLAQAVGSGQQLRGVSVGTNHACALDANGAIYCWGNGYHGQLGNNASGVFNTPQLVTGGRTYRAVAAGYLHTCAIGTDNHIYCWGNNHNGQLGTQYPGGWVSNPVQSIDP